MTKRPGAPLSPSSAFVCRVLRPALLPPLAVVALLYVFEARTGRSLANWDPESQDGGVAKAMALPRATPSPPQRLSHSIPRGAARKASAQGQHMN